MRFAFPIGLTTLAAAAAMALGALAAPADDYKAAYAKAEAASKQALAMKTPWATTVAARKAADAAAKAGKYDEAIALAKHAEALAEASIAQAKEQQAAWKDAVVR